MKTIIKYSCVLSVALTPAASWAGSPTFATSNSGVTSNPTTTTTTTTSTSGTSTSTTGSSGSVAGADKGVETSGGSSPSVKDSADQSSSANKGAQATQVLTGAMMFVMAAQQYAECSGANPGACALAAIYTGFGVLSMKQGKEHGSAAGSAGLTSFQSDGLGTNPYDYSDPSEYDDALSGDSSVKAISQNTKTLTSNGFLDPKTGKITTPDGKTYKASDFSSAASMAAAGIPKGAILGAVDAYDQVHKKAIAKVEKMKLGALTASNGYSEGGGGGGGGGIGGGSGEADPYASAGLGGGAGGTGLGINRDPSALAGMQKNYNGEPIGVAADSIFLMMTRRYKVKESQESFYTEAELALQK